MIFAQSVDGSMSSKESLEELAHAEYWDKRYTEKATTEDKYDWLRNFQAIKPFLAKHLPAEGSTARIIQLGCGNSVSLKTQATKPVER